MGFASCSKQVEKAKKRKIRDDEKAARKARREQNDCALANLDDSQPDTFDGVPDATRLLSSHEGHVTWANLLDSELSYGNLEMEDAQETCVS
jgi:hypothetical protein